MPELRTKEYDCAIIGAGPAGLTAAIYLRRFLRDVVLVHHGKPRAAWIPKCHNLIGYDEGISGADLLERLWKQVKDLNTEVVEGEAQVHCEAGMFIVRTEKEMIRAKKLILAIGMRDRQPGWANIVELRQSGLLRYCPICDLYEHRKKMIAVFGDSEHAAREALFISHHCNDVELILPSPVELSAEVKAKLNTKKIRVVTKAVLSVTIDKRANENVLRVKYDDQSERVFDAGYVALGITINHSALENLGPIKYSEDGLIKTDRHQRTSIPGAFAIGDCVEGLSQISVAAGQAAVAATAVHNDLRAEEFETSRRSREGASQACEVR